MAFKVPNRFRVRTHPLLGSTDADGNNGAFSVPSCRRGRVLQIVASDGLGWEHVSVSVMGDGRATPTWEEMCFIKDLFWSDDDTVVQFHPKKSEYVNRHPGCLHLWRPAGRDFRLPPRETVG